MATAASPAPALSGPTLSRLKRTAASGTRPSLTQVNSRSKVATCAHRSSHLPSTGSVGRDSPTIWTKASTTDLGAGTNPEFGNPRLDLRQDCFRPIEEQCRALSLGTNA